MPGGEGKTTGIPDQVETPSVEATATDLEGVETPSEETQEPVAKKSGEQKRIGKLAFKAREAERRAEEAEKKVTELQDKLNAALTQKDNLDAEAPKPDDFETHEEYLEVKLKHDMKVELAKFKADEARKAQAAQQAQSKAELDKKYTEQIDRGYELFGEDFVDAITAKQNTPLMKQHIGTSPNMAEIVMHLFNNPEEAVAMQSMSEAQLIRKIVTLEHEFSNKPPAAKVKSGAPPPPTGVGSNTPPAGQIDYSKLSGDEYKKMRERELEERYRAATGR